MEANTGSLWNFIKKSTEITSQINIKEQINCWKRLHKSKTPEILIDLEQFENVFTQNDHIGMVLGGRYQKYTSLFERFVRNLLHNDVKLTFFLAGQHFNDEPSIFIPHKENEYYRCIQLMDNLTADTIVKGNQNDGIQQKNFEHNMIEVIKQLCPKDSLHINYYRHLQEICKYANKNAENVLAIVSNDLQLLLFDGSYQFWYVNSIDFKKFKVTSFCRRTLENLLDLHTWQLQLLSVILGSVYIPSEFMDNWLLKRDIRLADTRTTDKIKQVASYVKQNSSVIIIDLEQIAMDLFGKYSKHDINAITNGLNTYNTEFSVKASNYDPFTEFSRQKNSFIFKLMVDDVFLIKDISYIDYREKRAQCYPSLIIPLIQKMIGILFKKQIIKPTDRKICMKIAHDEPYRIIRIPVIYPEVPMPSDTFHLVYKTREERFDTVRWTLLAWMFDFQDEFLEKLKALPRSYMTIAITLQYLLKQQAISVLEADAILYTEYMVQNRTVGDVTYPDLFENDRIQIAHLYTKVFALTNRCMEICGLKRKTELLQFNGPFFYSTLPKFTQSSPNLKSLTYLLALSDISRFRVYSTE